MTLTINVTLFAFDASVFGLMKYGSTELYQMLLIVHVFGKKKQ